MADGEKRRFRLALLLWACAFLAGLALSSAGVVRASAQALAFSFALGVAAIYVFFRPPAR